MIEGSLSQGGGGGGNEGGDQTDPMGRQLARWVDLAEGAAEDSIVGAGGASDQSGSWNSSEIRDRRRVEELVADPVDAAGAPVGCWGGRYGADLEAGVASLVRLACLELRDRLPLEHTEGK